MQRPAGHCGWCLSAQGRTMAARGIYRAIVFRRAVRRRQSFPGPTGSATGRPCARLGWRASFVCLRDGVVPRGVEALRARGRQSTCVVFCVWRRGSRGQSSPLSCCWAVGAPWVPRRPRASSLGVHLNSPLGRVGQRWVSVFGAGNNLYRAWSHLNSRSALHERQSTGAGQKQRRKHVSASLVFP